MEARTPNATRLAPGAGRGLFSVALVCVFLLGLAGEIAAAALPDFGVWREACRRLPPNRELGNGLPPRAALPLPSYRDFAAALDPFLDLSRAGSLAQAERWVGGMPRADRFFDLEAAYSLNPAVPFQPFAERHTVPPGTRLFLHGDLHGDIQALVTYLEALNEDGSLDGFRVAKPDVRLVFLGDYTDRGRYGVEVLYTLMRLKLANPEQVLLVRGNHEDVNLIARYGFLAEVAGKYGRAFDVRRVARLYEFLPSVLYVVCGTNVVQCNHGGIEPGYDPRLLLASPEPATYQLLGRLEQRRLLSAEPDWLAGLPAVTRRELEASLADFQPVTPTTPTVLGFLWNDFTVVAGEPQFAIDPGRAFVYGDEVTRLVLHHSSTPGHRVRAIFRGHQHAAELNPLMRRLVASGGVFRHWQEVDRLTRRDAAVAVLRSSLETSRERTIPDGSVWTFNVSPDSVYGAGCGYTFDTAGELVTASRWEDWRLRVWNFEAGAEGLSTTK